MGNRARTPSTRRAVPIGTKRERRSVRAPDYDGWSIGIYTGVSPLNLMDSSKIRNPVLSRRNVSDVRAAFVADPFMIKANGSWSMFFEVMNSKSDKGEIGFAISADGFRWDYQQIVLDEPFHLSYPYVFQWRRSYYMIPETLARSAVCLYKADPFPMRWKLVKRLIEGECADPSIFRFQNRWWMFVCARPYQHDMLRLFFADKLLGPWVEHPRSPIIRRNKRKARPGGRVLEVDGRVIRFTQDCYPIYGSAVRAFEITELSPTCYRERESAGSPILGGSGRGWNRFGMHTIDAHPISKDRWIACVDGVANK